jgi:hypothetical protein
MVKITDKTDYSRFVRPDDQDEGIWLDYVEVHLVTHPVGQVKEMHASHGMAELPPNELSLEERTLVTTLPVGKGARTVRLTSAGRELRLEVVAGGVGVRTHKTVSATVSHMFRLDEDLSAFYELVRDGEPAWSALGAGRMLRAPTVFEDVVKTNRPGIRTPRGTRSARNCGDRYVR